MSISNHDLISDALSLLGVVGESESMSAENGALGLRTLNELMADWEQDGVDLQYFEQTALTDDTPLPDHAVLAVKYYLAMALAPHFSKPVPPEFLALGDKYYSRLRRDAVKLKVPVSDLSHLPQGSGWGNAYNILTDE